MLLNPAMPELTVCNAVSSLVQVTELFTPMVTVRTTGEYPADDMLEPAPRGMLTFTFVPEVDRVVNVVLVELILVVLVDLTVLVETDDVLDCEWDTVDVVICVVVEDVMVEVKFWPGEMYLEAIRKTRRMATRVPTPTMGFK